MAASLLDYGWDDRIAVAAASAAGVVGRVTRIDRGAFYVATEHGLRTARLSGELKSVRDPTTRPTIGDWVVIDETTVSALLPRSSAFVRGDIDRLQAQVVAANIDTVFVVHSAAQEANPRRLERELVLAWQSGASPVVVLTKVDLCSDPAPVRTLLERSAPRVDVEVVSGKTGEGVDRLARYGWPHHTLAFIGASGVGKSTLINALLGSQVQATAETRGIDQRGRHTTTARSLFLLSGGGVLVDTPGLRSVGMWRSDAGIALAFDDLELLARSCKFSDCTHDHEPGCAVLAAVDRGVIDSGRVAHYRQLQLELDRLDDEAELRSRVVKQQQRSQPIPPREPR